MLPFGLGCRKRQRYRDVSEDISELVVQSLGVKIDVFFISKEQMFKSRARSPTGVAPSPEVKLH